MKELESLRQTLLKEYHRDTSKPVRVDLSLVYSFLNDTKRLLTLDYLNPDFTAEMVDDLLAKIKTKLELILAQSDVKAVDSKAKTASFLDDLPNLKRLLSGSIEAILNGDPAAQSREEIVTCYPGFAAILNYRIAHSLYGLGLFFVSRVITEEAHRSTGIDINPGATIGKNFFIDHGTGIVIGETALIGDNVKLYQGVTLGARSLSKGRMLVGMKRHPTIGNNVTIYSSASILGGDTVIGDNTTVGANVYITSSVPKDSIVYLGNSGIRVIDKVSAPQTK